MSGGQEQIDCGRSHLGCVSGVMFFDPFDLGSVRLSIVGGSAVITRKFINDVGSEVRRRSGLRFGE